jgi:hypothetical protein
VALARLVAAAPGKTVSYEFVASHLWQAFERSDNSEALILSMCVSHIAPGKLQQNAFAESFIGRLR